MSWILYKHTNLCNGKSYIGITSKSVEQRWGKNGSGYKASKNNGVECFYNAIQKYGWENFTHEILLENLSMEEAFELEKTYIIKFKSKAPYGYNLTDGGEGSKGYKASDEFRLRRSELTSLGNNPTAHKVQYADLVFDTIKECADYLGVSRNKIVRWITGKTIIPDIYLKNNLRFIDEPPVYKTSKIQPEKADVILYMGKCYKSIKECADIIGVKETTLGAWLRGEHKLGPRYWYLADTDLCYIANPIKLEKCSYENQHLHFQSKGESL